MQTSGFYYKNWMFKPFEDEDSFFKWLLINSKGLVGFRLTGFVDGQAELLAYFKPDYEIEGYGVPIYATFRVPFKELMQFVEIFREQTLEHQLYLRVEGYANIDGRHFHIRNVVLSSPGWQRALREYRELISPDSKNTVKAVLDHAKSKGR